MLPFITIGSVQLPTYFVWMSLIATIGAIWVQRKALARNVSVSTALEIYLLVIVGGPVFARLIFAVWEQPEFYMRHPLSILNIWEGGFVYFGGMIGSIALTAIYLRKLKQSIWPWLDFFAPVLSLGYALGRLGCFWAGCCYGDICDLPWAMQFPLVDANFRHPTQLYATFCELLAFFVVFRLSNNIAKDAPATKDLRPGFVFACWLVLHGAGRLVMEFFRDDARGPVVLGLTLGQWVAGVVVLAGVRLAISRGRRSKPV